MHDVYLVTIISAIYMGFTPGTLTLKFLFIANEVRVSSRKELVSIPGIRSTLKREQETLEAVFALDN